MSTRNPAPRKFFNYTPGDIKAYLSEFKKCIIGRQYSISKNDNRKENIDFIEDYKITTKKEQEILLGLQFDDFCYAVENDNRNFPDGILYIFCKQHELDFWGILETVDIYIKVNMIETRSDNLTSIIFSFHKKNFEITYLFR